MSNVLYRKYRAQNFDELLGQSHITKILKNAIKKDQISHAYLFVGSRGTGKTSTARILAKAVNCKDIGKDGNPCSKCEVCKGIENGTYLDLIEIDAASNRGIDQIRELKEKIEFSPSNGRYKVYIIDEVHMLTTEAFNALLKTLEEPPKHVLFILATTDVHKLPATILSRCQRYDFKLGSDEEILGMLNDICKKEKVKLEEKAIEILVRNARGSFRDALSLLDVVVNAQTKEDGVISESEVREILGIPEIHMVDMLLNALIGSDAKKALECIEEIQSKGINVLQFTSLVLEILREVLVYRVSGRKLNEEYTFESKVDQKQLMQLINAFLTVERDLRNSTNHILILELLIPQFCNIDKGSSIKKSVEVKKEKPKKEDKTIVEKSSEKVEVINHDANIDISFDDIKKNWNKIVDDIKPIHSQLSAFLSFSNPVGISGNTIDIEVPFKFHKDQIDTPQSKELVCNVIREVIGIPCKLNCIVNDKVKPKVQSSADVLLKNIPKFEKKKEESPKEFKRVKADVDAIFAGM